VTVMCVTSLTEWHHRVVTWSPSSSQVLGDRRRPP